MKLSDAILLGSTVLKLNSSIYLSVDCGCLIGMGAKALGKAARELFDGKGDFNFQEYPWLLDKVQGPPGLGFYSRTPHPAFAIIGEMARCIEDGSYTMERAVDWIRSVEPQELATTDSHEQIELSGSGPIS